MADETSFWKSAGGGAAIGGGAGMLAGLLGMNQQRKQWKKMSQELNPRRMLDVQAALYPEFMSYKAGGHQDLLASLLGGANAGYGSAMTNFNDALARSGLLGSGVQMGGNAALGLARGRALNQARVQAMLQLLAGERASMGGVLQRALGFGGLAGQSPYGANPIMQGMQGAALGAQMFRPQDDSSGGGTTTTNNYYGGGYGGADPRLYDIPVRPIR